MIISSLEALDWKHIDALFFLKPVQFWFVSRLVEICPLVPNCTTLSNMHGCKKLSLSGCTQMDIHCHVRILVWFCPFFIYPSSVISSAKICMFRTENNVEPHLSAKVIEISVTGCDMCIVRVEHPPKSFLNLVPIFGNLNFNEVAAKQKWWVLSENTSSSKKSLAKHFEVLHGKLIFFVGLGLKLGLNPSKRPTKKW